MIPFSEAYTLTFSQNQVQRLEDILREGTKLNNYHLYRMAMSLLWKAQDRSTQQIATFFKMSERTVQRWISDFLEKGEACFYRYKFRGRGRKRKLSKEMKQQLAAIIDEGPQAYGFSTAVWNSALIREVIFSKWGILYNPRYLCALLKKMGFSVQKACFVSDKRSVEEYEKARKEWQEETWPSILKQARRDNAVILFGDEVSFAMWGSLCRTWSRRGEQPVVRTKGIRKGAKMFGAIDFFKGSFHYMESLTGS